MFMFVVLACIVGFDTSSLFMSKKLKKLYDIRMNKVRLG